MKPTFEKLKQELTQKNIKLSHQRLKVLEYLTQNHCHPTADMIFTGLLEDIPTLSKTTVYNTLHILVQSGLVRAITTEDKESRYDIAAENHGHFKCESCENIFDFPIEMDCLVSRDLSKFKINEKNIYFKGLCPGCLAIINKQVKGESL